MPKLLTVKEAAQLTGKSPSSIRRIIYPILENPKHPDRSQIEPSAKKATELRLKGENFPWRISEEFLKRIPVDESKAKSALKGTAASSDASSAVFIEMLRQELAIKNQQIATQNQLIANQNEIMKGLSERLREGNILIGSLQQQLALPDASRHKNGIVDAASEQGSEGTQTTNTETLPPSEKKDQSPPTKPHWLFRKIF
jgi:hypothetical protein